MKTPILVNKTRLTSSSAIYHMKLMPSTDVWVCVHGVGYPDICQECRLAYRGLFLQETTKEAK
jgi:hypothetical protein